MDALASPEAATLVAIPDINIVLGLAGVPVALIGAYGCARAGGVVMSELRNAVFAKVAQGAIRKVGGQVGTSTTCPSPTNSHPYLLDGDSIFDTKLHGNW